MIYGRQDPHIKYDGRLETYKRMHEAGVVVVDTYTNTDTVTPSKTRSHTSSHLLHHLPYSPSQYTISIHPLTHPL